MGGILHNGTFLNKLKSPSNSRLSLGPSSRASSCSSVNSSDTSSSTLDFPFFFPPLAESESLLSTSPTPTKSSPALNSFSSSHTLLPPASGWMRRSRTTPRRLIGSGPKNGDAGLLGNVLVMRWIFCCGSLFLLRDCNLKTHQWFTLLVMRLQFKNAPIVHSSCYLTSI